MKRCMMTLVSLSLIVLAVGPAARAQDKAKPTKTLHDAAMQGDLEQINANLENGADVNKADSAGMVPLAYAASTGAAEAVKLLLEKGANVNVKIANGRTVLMEAAQAGNMEIVSALLAAQADVKAKDISQATALHVAAERGHVEVAEALIKAGADLNAENGTQETPIMLAGRQRHMEVVDLLKKNGAREPVMMDGREGLYGGNEGTPGPMQGPAPAPAHTADVQIDPNAIAEQVKRFEGLAQALQTIDANSAGEQRSWITRRTDNRTVLQRAADRQFGDELVFLKRIATEEKAAKTIEGIDVLAAARTKRSDAIGDAVREERRAAMQQGATTGTSRGRTTTRTTRGRTGTGMSARGGTDVYGEAGAGASAASRRREPNEPPMDADTQSQVQAWVGGRPENKASLLDEVHKLDLAELADLRVIATEEEAKKTAAAISGLMLARDQRVQKIKQEWLKDDERQQKLQERLGATDGTMRGRGTRGGAGMPGQTGQTGQTGAGRRYR